jgi:hypothetical protein
MSTLRQTRPARDGKAGYEVEGMPGHTYNEETAKRLQYMDEDGNFHFPEDGKLAEVKPAEHDEYTPAALGNPSGRP